MALAFINHLHSPTPISIHQPHLPPFHPPLPHQPFRSQIHPLRLQIQPLLLLLPTPTHLRRRRRQCCSRRHHRRRKVTLQILQVWRRRLLITLHQSLLWWHRVLFMFLCSYVSAFCRWQLGRKGKGKSVLDLGGSYYYSYSLFFIILLG